MSSPMEVSRMATYTPTTELAARHSYSVHRHRRAQSTGGGRAWSDNEEAFLLRNRQHKMPYKEIAAQLNKTELACRLHYHQINSGSSRRKRNRSCSSTPSDYSALVREHESRMSPMSPPDSTSASISGSPLMKASMTGFSLELPAIRPKPQSANESPAIPEDRRLPPIQAYTNPQFERHQKGQPLRLDTSSLPPLSTSVSPEGPNVDLGRLHAIYLHHRETFWKIVATEYGQGVSPSHLEQAWKSGLCGHQRGGSPITPNDSPVSDMRVDRTSISSILGPERNPWDLPMSRVPEERGF